VCTPYKLSAECLEGGDRFTITRGRRRDRSGDDARGPASGARSLEFDWDIRALDIGISGEDVDDGREASICEMRGCEESEVFRGRRM